jgi:AraC family transcriptional regulator, regulatory protein of adaptative response / methylated-DNA-[protein]-cysteine methyltransferase
MNDFSHYVYIQKAIEFITLNVKNQPKLEEIASHVGLSTSYFQRVFTEWAGTSPKKFLHFLSLNYAKSLLLEKQNTLFDTTHEMGLSSTSRLHDLFINIEGMTPAEFKNGGKDLEISYGFLDSIFGKLIIGSTKKGVCSLLFYEDENLAINNLKCEFPNANFIHKATESQYQVQLYFEKNESLKDLKLHLKGTAFQLKVWSALLSIPQGEVSSYGALAKKIECPKAARAVGTAIGSNPVAFLIPCHRVIQSSGILGGYMWGETKKKAIFTWEAFQNEIL